MRVIATDYVNAYREGGNARLAVYRDAEHPTFVANEFRELVNAMPLLSEYLPDMRHYLLEYPKPPTQKTISFYWQEAEFGLKPTIRISHVAIQQDKEATIVASKQLYSTHYFWTALELRALIADPARGAGFWFVNVNRSRSDGLSGFVGSLICCRVRDSARKGLESALTAAKKTLEGAFAHFGPAKTRLVTYLDAHLTTRSSVGQTARVRDQTTGAPPRAGVAVDLFTLSAAIDPAKLPCFEQLLRRMECHGSDGTGTGVGRLAPAGVGTGVGAKYRDIQASSGVVTDGSGGVIPGATVVVKNNATECHL